VSERCRGDNVFRLVRDLSSVREGEVGDILLEVFGDYLNNQTMVLSLGQPRNRDRSDTSGSLEKNREGTAMVRIIASVEGLEIEFLGLHHQADRVRTPEKPSHDITLAPHPFGVVRRCSLACKIEEWESMQLNIDHDGKLSFFGDLAKLTPEFPGGLGVKVIKLQTFFLQSDSLEILLDFVHG